MQFGALIDMSLGSRSSIHDCPMLMAFHDEEWDTLSNQFNSAYHSVDPEVLSQGWRGLEAEVMDLYEDGELVLDRKFYGVQVMAQLDLPSDTREALCDFRLGANGHSKFSLGPCNLSLFNRSCIPHGKCTGR